MLTPLRIVSIAAVLTAGATLSAGGVSAASVPDDADGTVTVTDAGNPDSQIDLSTPPAVGDSAEVVTETATEGSLSVSNGGDLPLDATATLTQSFEVTAVDGVGFTAVGVIDSIESTSAFGDSIPDYEDPLAGLIGVPLEYALSGPFAVNAIAVADDAPVGPDNDVLVDAMGQLSSVGAVAVPAEPVGEGATWTATTDWILDGTTSIPVTVAVELVSVDGTAYELRYDVEIDAAESFPLDEGEHASGTLSISGSIAGDVAEPLAWTSTGSGRADIRLEGVGEDDPTVTMTAVSSIERTSSPT